MTRRVVLTSAHIVTIFIGCSIALAIVCHYLGASYYSPNERRLIWEIQASTGIISRNYNVSRTAQSRWHYSITWPLAQLGHKMDVLLQRKNFSAGDVDAEHFLAALAINPKLHESRFLMSWGGQEVWASVDGRSYVPVEPAGSNGDAGTAVSGLPGDQ
jgi:hypothetical protein